MTGDILFLAHRMPFPPDRGDKIRSHHLLKALAKLAPVHVGCFGDTQSDFLHEPELAQVASTHCLLPRRKSLPRAGVEAVASGKPVSLTAFDDRKLHAWVEKTLSSRPIGTIFVFSGQMGQYVPDDFEGRVVIDLCDVDSAKFEAYARDAGFVKGLVHAREGRLLANEEARLAERARHTLLVSEAEAQLFASRLSSKTDRSIRAVRNGIDARFFDTESICSVESGPFANEAPNIVFTGQMDYPPNVSATKRIMDRLLPAIRRQHPGATFHCVGRAPVSELTARDGEPGVRVWGEVPDVRPFLAAADLVLAPLEIARGVQNKVLEAMAMARPVLVSREAATGIDATDGEHFEVGENDRQLIERANDLLSDPSRASELGKAARKYVVEQQGWEAMLAPLGDLCGFAAELEHRDAA